MYGGRFSFLTPAVCPTGAFTIAGNCDSATKTRTVHRADWRPFQHRYSASCDVSKVEDCPAIDCQGDWGYWSACDPATKKTTRTYTVNTAASTNSKILGKACPRANGTKETMTCTTDECIAGNGPWGQNINGINKSKPGSDDFNCNTLDKLQYSQYKVSQQGLGVKGCPKLDNIVDTRPCDAKCVGAWVDQGTCNQTTGKQSQKYVVSTAARNAGTCSPAGGALQDVTCKVDCVVSAYGAFGACDSKTGLQTRSRTITTQPKNATCPSLTDTRSCDEDCEVTTTISNCDPITGKQKITKTIKAAARGNGKACPTAAELITRDEDCKINCIGSWTPGTCNTKTKKQQLTYKVNLNASFGGTACEAVNGSVKDAPCDIACVGAHVANWSACDAATGKQTKAWSVTTEQSGVGAACKPLAALSQNCDVNCHMSNYVYAECNATTGKQTGTRKIITAAKNSGTACPTTLTTTKDCNIDCIGAWSAWTPAGCTDPTKIQTATYNISRPKQHDGISCDYADKVTKTRNCPSANTPPVSGLINCVGSWSVFSNCADGKQTSTYSVTTPASGGGTQCVASAGATDIKDCEMSSSWYKNPLILGGIAGGIILLIVIIFFMMKKKPSIPVI